MNNSLYTLCQECAFQYLFLPLALSGRALQFLEYEQFGGKQLKAKVFSLYSKKKIYLVEFNCLKYTDLNVVGVYKQHEVCRSKALRKHWHSGNSCSAASAPDPAGTLWADFPAVSGTYWR